MDPVHLATAIDGTVLTAASPDFGRVAPAAISRFAGIVPRAVVRCATPGDVAAAIAAARAAQSPVAVRSGGHCFAGRSSTTGILIDVGPMDRVEVSGELATVGAGAPLGQVYDVLARHGRTIPAGCGPTVGIAGLTLGGGLGILGRTHGLTADSLRAAQVVLADGSIVGCDQDRDADLFWALRGAGGAQFGVVTSLTLATVPEPEITTFHLTWTAPDAVAVVAAWQAWSPAGPDALAASLLLTAPADAIRPLGVNVFGGLQGDAATADRLLDDLVGRVGVTPRSRTRQRHPYAAAKRFLAELGDAMARPGDQAASDPAAMPPTWDASRSEFFARPLPVPTIERLLGWFAGARVPGQARELDLSPWGGAYNRVPADATAFAHRDELFLLKHAVSVDLGAPSAAREAAQAWLTRSWEAVRPWGTGRVYPNFPDPDLDGWARAYHGDNLDRLRRVKGRYDPDGVFTGPQSIAPARGR